MKQIKKFYEDNPRYEKKYLIPYSAQAYLRHIIKTSKLSFKVQHKKRNIESFLNNSNFPVVVKSDGLASGKGVTICSSREEVKRDVKKICFN